LQEIDSFNRAADVALAAFQELDEQFAIKDSITISGRPLDEEVFLLEHELIKHALEKADGRVTTAARSLGMGYQRFTHKLKTQHQDLLNYRNPSRQRKRRA
jgi:DNA-binding NtrC family response regulator